MIRIHWYIMVCFFKASTQRTTCVLQSCIIHDVVWNMLYDIARYRHIYTNNNAHSRLPTVLLSRYLSTFMPLAYNVSLDLRDLSHTCTTRSFYASHVCTPCNNYTLLSKFASECWYSPQQCTPACVKYRGTLAFAVVLYVEWTLSNTWECIGLRMITCHMHMLTMERARRASLTGV